MMKIPAVVALLLLFPQEKNEAEELFKKMEEKLSKAVTMQLKAAGSAPMSGGEMSFSASIFVGKENKARIDSEMKTPMGDAKFASVSNGAVLRSEKEGESRSTDTPKTLTADLIRGFARAGGLFSCGWLDAMSEKDSTHPQRQKIPELAGLKLGKKEKVGTRDAQSIEFTIKGLESGEVPCVLWIDVETHLPLKREIRGMHGQEKMVLTESYSELKLDEKIDAAKFEIPKETK